MTTIEYIVLYVVGAAVTALVCGMTDLDDAPLAVIFWPVLLAALVGSAPFYFAFRTGRVLRKRSKRRAFERRNGSGPL